MGLTCLEKVRWNPICCRKGDVRRVSRVHLLERSTSEGRGLDCHLSSLVDSLPALPGPL